MHFTPFIVGVLASLTSAASISIQISSDDVATSPASPPLTLPNTSPNPNSRVDPSFVALGRLSHPHGYFFIAWNPSTTTVQQACTTHTAIQHVETNSFDHPICGTTFSVADGGDPLTDVQLICNTYPPQWYSEDLVGVVKVASNGSVARTMPCYSMGQPVGYSCDTSGTYLDYEYYCSSGITPLELEGGRKEGQELLKEGL